MNRFYGVIIALAMFFTMGCAESRLKRAGSEAAWNEDIQEDAKDLSTSGKGYLPYPEGQDAKNDLVFFNRSKPQLKTIQIWLESGTILTGQIKAYLASFFSNGVTDSPDIAPAQKLVGQWYGLDRKDDTALVFTFLKDGTFEWRSREVVINGTYTMGPDNSLRMTPLKPEDKTNELISFEFVNDRALLFTHKEKTLILLKR